MARVMKALKMGVKGVAVVVGAAGGAAVSYCTYRYVTRSSYGFRVDYRGEQLRLETPDDVLAVSLQQIGEIYPRLRYLMQAAGTRVINDSILRASLLQRVEAALHASPALLDQKVAIPTEVMEQARMAAEHHHGRASHPGVIEATKGALKESFVNISANGSAEFTCRDLLMRWALAPAADYYFMYDAINSMATAYNASAGRPEDERTLKGSDMPRYMAALADAAYELDTMTQAGKLKDMPKGQAVDTLHASFPKLFETLKQLIDERPAHVPLRGALLAPPVVDAAASPASLIPLIDADGNTRAIVLHDPRRRQAVIMSVGTDFAYNWWRTNFKCWHTNLDPKVHGIAMAQGRAHAGFVEMFDTIWDQVPAPMRGEGIHDAHALFSKKKGYDVLLVGHSLGGSLSQLFGSALAQSPTVERVRLFTTAATRVYDPTAAAVFSNNPKVSNVRMHHEADIAPTFPPQWMGYRHCGTPLPVLLQPSDASDYLTFLKTGFASSLYHGIALYQKSLASGAANFAQTSYIAVIPEQDPAFF